MVVEIIKVAFAYRATLRNNGSSPAVNVMEIEAATVIAKIANAAANDTRYVGGRKRRMRSTHRALSKGNFGSRTPAL